MLLINVDPSSDMTMTDVGTRCITEGLLPDVLLIIDFLVPYSNLPLEMVPVGGLGLLQILYPFQHRYLLYPGNPVLLVAQHQKFHRWSAPTLRPLSLSLITGYLAYLYAHGNEQARSQDLVSI